MRFRSVLPLILSIVSATALCQSTPPAVGNTPPWLASLTPAQRAEFDRASKSFGAQDYKAALPVLRKLHEEVPANEILAKYTAEAAVNTGDFAYAQGLLDPVLKGNPDDPQALGIEAHLAGQQHQVERRDALLDRIQKLYDSKKPAPRFVIVENDPMPGGGTVRISDYIEPLGRFHVVLMAEYFDAAGARTHRTALESDDIDQMQFGKDHPVEAAAGVRIYSMDGYSETRNAQGQMTGQTHSTLCPVPGCFLTGRPTYEFFRTAVLAPAKAGPISSTAAPVASPK